MEVKVIPVLFHERATAEEDAAMLALCVRKISGKFWLMGPLVSLRERDLDDEDLRDDVPIIDPQISAMFPSKG